MALDHASPEKELEGLKALEKRIDEGRLSLEELEAERRRLDQLDQLLEEAQKIQRAEGERRAEESAPSTIWSFAL